MKRLIALVFLTTALSFVVLPVLLGAQLFRVQPHVGNVIRIASTANAECSIARPCSQSVNIAWDSIGTPCQGSGVWGNCDAVQVPIAFTNVPAGTLVRIRRLYGDQIAWIHGNPAPGSHAGILWSAQGDAAQAAQMLVSGDTQVGASYCFIYHQGVVGAGDFTRLFDNAVAGGMLTTDNTFVVQFATFLNDTGASVHQELTFVVVYDFE